MSSRETQKVRVWDLPTRLFHWCLLICVIGSFVSVKIGGNAMQWHFYFGYAILIMLLFRIMWGFLGNQYAKFSSFLPNPMAALRAVRGERSFHLGHNPLGAFSVYGLLISFSFQAVSGLFSNDDIGSEGPVATKISKDLSDSITSAHKINETIMIILVILHILALVYYHYIKKERLVRAMVTGDKEVITTAHNIKHGQDDTVLRLRALITLFVCAGLVWWLVKRF